MLALVVLFYYFLFASLFGTLFVISRVHKRQDPNEQRSANFCFNIFQEIGLFIAVSYLLFCSTAKFSGYDDEILKFSELALMTAFSVPFVAGYLVVLEAGWVAVWERKKRRDLEGKG